MPTIALIQTKGGSGKTTSGLNIAYALARKGAGLTVGVCDLDINQGATKWLRAHPHEHISLLPVANEEEDVDLRIIDTEGRSRVEQSLSVLPRSVSLFIVPCGPSGLDIEAAETAVKGIRLKRPETAIRLLWNRVNLAANNSQPQVLAEHAKQIGIPAFKGFISRSAAFEDEREKGWTVLKHSHREQVEGLAIEILSLLSKLGSK